MQQNLICTTTQFSKIDEPTLTSSQCHPMHLSPRQSLNKAFLKVKPNRSEIERFKANLIQLLDRTNYTESKEFHNNYLGSQASDF